MKIYVPASVNTHTQGHMSEHVPVLACSMVLCCVEWHLEHADTCVYIQRVHMTHGHRQLHVHADDWRRIGAFMCKDMLSTREDISWKKQAMCFAHIPVRLCMAWFTHSVHSTRCGLIQNDRLYVLRLQSLLQNRCDTHSTRDAPRRKHDDLPADIS